jgi:hypothetical protein
MLAAAPRRLSLDHHAQQPRPRFRAPEQLQAQTQVFAHYRQAAPGACLAVPGADHFSILNALADPQGVALQALLALDRA